MLILKAIILQLYWYVAVYYGRDIHDAYLLISLVIILFLNYKFYDNNISLKNYIILCFLFSLYGLIQDSLLLYLEIFKFYEGYYPLWMNSLFIIFIAYYGDIFSKFYSWKNYQLFILGGVAGAFAYWSGSKLGAMSIETSLYIFSFCLFISWGIFFTGSLRLFEKFKLQKN